MGVINFQLSSDYGYVILVIIASWVLLQYLGFKVMKARKTYKVEYPALYSDKSDEFNCVQRAHQNTLEVYPMYLVFQIIGGIFLPKLSAVFGLIFLLGRILYAQGYYTFEPKNRNRGVVAYIGYLGLIVNCILFAVNLITSA